MDKINDQFFPFLTKLSKQNKRSIPKRVLSIDPGETTGYADFIDGHLLSTDMLEVKKEGLGILNYLAIKNLSVVNYDYVIIEDYRIYPNMLSEHSLSAVFPVKVIGVLQYIFELQNIPIVFQMASTGKAFCTNEKLKEWGYWIKGKVHSRDAIRHACYFLLFAKELNK